VACCSETYLPDEPASHCHELHLEPSQCVELCDKSFDKKTARFVAPVLSQEFERQTEMVGVFVSLGRHLTGTVCNPCVVSNQVLILKLTNHNPLINHAIKNSRNLLCCFAM